MQELARSFVWVCVIFAQIELYFQMSPWFTDFVSIDLMPFEWHNRIIHSQDNERKNTSNSFEINEKKNVLNASEWVPFSKQTNKQNEQNSMQSARRHLKLVNVEFHCRNLCIWWPIAGFPVDLCLSCAYFYGFLLFDAIKILS